MGHDSSCNRRTRGPHPLQSMASGGLTNSAGDRVWAIFTCYAAGSPSAFVPAATRCVFGTCRNPESYWRAARSVESAEEARVSVQARAEARGVMVIPSFFSAGGYCMIVYITVCDTFKHHFLDYCPFKKPGFCEGALIPPPPTSVPISADDSIHNLSPLRSTFIQRSQHHVANAIRARLLLAALLFSHFPHCLVVRHLHVSPQAVRVQARAGTRGPQGPVPGLRRPAQCRDYHERAVGLCRGAAWRGGGAGAGGHQEARAG